MSRPNRAIEALVRTRAQHRCEYCLSFERRALRPFQVDHIIAEKHGGLTIPENLALSCYPCNMFKGPNISGIDSVTRKISRLFHPRTDRWADHFAWRGASLTGLTPVGRATIETLRINHPDALRCRTELIEEGEL